MRVPIIPALLQQVRICISVSHEGLYFFQDSDSLLASLPRSIRYEVGFQTLYGLRWMENNSFLPIGILTFYAIACIAGKRYMRDRPAWNWRRSMALWNFTLSLFSFIGMMRTMPILLHNLTAKSIRDNMCNDAETSYGSGSTGLWVQLFVYSKIPELLDTFFIIIHKKPLIFLHWYHHITVLLYCWFGYANRSPYGLFFCAMNYSVHAIMYGYYFLMAVKLKPKWLNAMFITAAQISQMIVGVIVTVFSFYYYTSESANRGSTNLETVCHIQFENVVSAFLMYGSYLFLFMQFFVQRYFKKRSSKNAGLAVEKKSMPKKID
jgi:elongation of very long chain fatty acids protein 6